ncbi:MAG: hypothetical protein AAF975_06290, partial [Spirochaetota bacterium]
RLHRVADRVAVKSYPLNLWEKGFTRHGQKIKGVYALRKLKADVGGGKLAAWSQQFMQERMQKR